MRRVPLWPFVIIQLYCAVVFTTAGARQLVGAAAWSTQETPTWAATLQHQLTQWQPHSWWWYRPVVADLLIPHVSAIALLVAWCNVLVGVGFFLGVWTRGAAACAAVLLLNAIAAAGGQPYYPGPTAAYLALVVAIILTNPGQLWGIAALKRLDTARLVHAHR